MNVERNYGLKVALPGYDVATAPEYKQVLNSSFPVLKVLHEAQVTITNPQNDQVVYTHNLGYYPFILVWDNTTSSQSSPSMMVFNNFGVGINTIRWIGAPVYGTDPLTLYYYVFQNNLLTNYISDIGGGVAEESKKSRDYGVKILGNAKNIRSTDYRDFNIHSKCQNLTIHKSGFATSVNTSLGGGLFEFEEEIVHNLGYPATTFFFFKDTSGGISYYFHMSTSQESFLTLTDNSSKFNALSSSLSTDYAYVILKDPII